MLSAGNFVKQSDVNMWMNKRKMGDAKQKKLEQNWLIRDIFIALDEDGSGTMDQDELIKAMLSLGLSQDIDFAKRIITVFRDNKMIALEKK